MSRFSLFCSQVSQENPPLLHTFLPALYHDAVVGVIDRLACHPQHALEERVIGR